MHMEREKVNKEEMESLALTLEMNSQGLMMNNEMVVEARTTSSCTS